MKKYECKHLKEKNNTVDTIKLFIKDTMEVLNDYDFKLKKKSNTAYIYEYKGKKGVFTLILPLENDEHRKVFSLFGKFNAINNLSYPNKKYNFNSSNYKDVYNDVENYIGKAIDVLDED